MPQLCDFMINGGLDVLKCAILFWLCWFLNDVCCGGNDAPGLGKPLRECVAEVEHFRLWSGRRFVRRGRGGGGEGRFWHLGTLYGLSRCKCELI